MMARKRFLTPLLMTSLLASLSLLGGPLMTSLAWATSHEKPAMGTQMAPSPQLMTPAPTTLDGYTTFVADKLQLEAMKIKQPGTAEVKLTIGRDGTVRQTEVVRLEGPATLRNQIPTMVSQMGKLPPLPEANVESLVMTTTLAFNYPGSELLDRFSRVPTSGR